MNKPLVGALVIILVVLGGGYFYWSTMGPGAQQAAADYKNISYTIEGQPVTLVDGKAETEAAPGSASKVTTIYFGNVGKGDLNGDSIPDLAFLLTQDQGGSGTFYYVVAALQNADGSYTGTNGVVLGDRIAPQTTEIRDGQILVNYADRAPGEPMTAQPSVGVTKTLRVSGNTLAEASGKIPAGATGMGTYTYECDEHVMFTMTPADEMTSISIRPMGEAAFPPALTLLPIATPKGKTGHYFTDDTAFLFVGNGESVTIRSKGSDPLNCSPVADSNSAPWNWGGLIHRKNARY